MSVLPSRAAVLRLYARVFRVARVWQAQVSTLRPAVLYYNVVCVAGPGGDQGGAAVHGAGGQGSYQA